MWRNAEFAAFVPWLRDYNLARPTAERAGFFGLDIYGMNASIGAVLGYLDRIDTAAAAAARERYSCLAPWRADPAAYGHAVLTGGYQAREQYVISQLRALLEKRLEYMRNGPDAFFDAAQNARMVAAAERYYRVMYWGAAASWNLRDTYRFETLQRLLQRHGPASKAVVWAHNSHIGNAAATAMSWQRGELNLGQLCREHYGSAAASIGFGTDHGTVAAASDWDGPMAIKRVLPAREDSYERIAHDSGVPRFFLDLREGSDAGPRIAIEATGAVRAALMPPRQERFIGVIYRPETEFLSHYAEASLPQQFDAWIWFDETAAIEALPAPASGQVVEDLPETYSFGL
jgi:erythromycin esterase-like protein